MAIIVEQVEPVLPVDAFAAVADAPYPLLLDSAGAPRALARYSYLTAQPFLVLRATGSAVVVEEGQTQRRQVADPFAALDALMKQFRQPVLAGLPPFQGGAAGYWAYELGRVIERLPGRARADLPLPECLIGLYDWVLAHDHQLNQSWIICTGLPDGGEGAARQRLAWVRERLSRSDSGGTTAWPASTGISGSTFTRASYMEAVRLIKAYIAAGDAYQVNLSQRLSAPLPGEPWPLYRRLRALSPAPFAAYLGLGPGSAVLSASPERFLRLDGRRVETRPIKGTRPRGADAAADALLRADLQTSVKDRAENLMIVDLLRNDLGRVCRPGSIVVPDLFSLEPHPTVWQQVSVVTGELEQGVTPLELLRSCFPGGSVTGAPKIRAMEIIDELEPVARGVYCGAIGYVSFGGQMDTSIPIRTIVAHAGVAHVNVGGGIVADSDPEAEYVETLHKARGALRALGIVSVEGDATPR
ncbi:MAG TPA: aminodeoxychorismate synthase component I [Chloroflexota bacterium]|nr:aminodeoxychorismate synthase component I [Chloroflexota bacterium]